MIKTIIMCHMIDEFCRSAATTFVPEEDTHLENYNGSMAKQVTTARLVQDLGDDFSRDNLQDILGIMVIREWTKKILKQNCRTSQRCSDINDDKIGIWWWFPTDGKLHNFDSSHICSQENVAEQKCISSISVSIRKKQLEDEWREQISNMRGKQQFEKVWNSGRQSETKVSIGWEHRKNSISHAERRSNTPQRGISTTLFCCPLQKRD